jgi:hypothetical protein
MLSSEALLPSCGSGVCLGDQGFDFNTQPSQMGCFTSLPATGWHCSLTRGMAGTVG